MPIPVARRALLGAALATSLMPAARGQNQPRENVPDPANPRLPADATTRHSLQLACRTLSFSATAGAIRLFDEKRTPLVDLAFVAYQLDGGDHASRPVTFVF